MEPSMEAKRETKPKGTTKKQNLKPKDGKWSTKGVKREPNGTQMVAEATNVDPKGYQKRAKWRPWCASVLGQRKHNTQQQTNTTHEHTHTNNNTKQKQQNTKKKHQQQITKKRVTTTTQSNKLLFNKSTWGVFGHGYVCMLCCGVVGL